MRIVIDGNIGSGKTSQLDLLGTLGYKIKKEPIDQWPLELFYSDPERWGFLFQIVVLQTFDYGPDDGFTILERCPSSSKDVFWSIMNKNQVEDIAYTYEFNRHAWYPDVYIFIHKPPEMCYRHIQERTQAGDSKVSLEYLKVLDGQYEKMFETIPCKHKHRIDGSQSIQDVFKEISAIIKKYKD